MLTPIQRIGRFVCCVLGLFLALVVAAERVSAESYVGGMFGWTFPGQEVTDVSIRGGPSNLATTPISSRTMAGSYMYGFKAGHYLESLKWLGLEFEGFTTTPHIQSLEATSAIGALPGQHFRVTTAALNLMVRNTGQLQYYAGLGAGAFFGQLQNAQKTETQTDIRPGLNTQLGLRYFFTKNTTLFGEWKFNHTQFRFNSSPNFTGTDFRYDAHHILFGVGYHFQ